jgi:DNA-binding IscR family transcriptional regulator
VGDLIRILDGPLAPIRCASLTAYKKCDDCADENTCEIRHTMMEVRNAISEVLDKKSLLEMMDKV